MLQPHHGWTDQRVEQIIGNLLRAGVLTAAAVVLLGGVLYLGQEGGTVHHYEKFQGEPAALRRVPDIVADAAALKGDAVIQF
jgi:hypothetical protein